MKKNSMRQIKDYSKYSYTDPEYYGLLMKNGKVRIDVKRIEKTRDLDQRIINHMNKPRKTVYFIPYKNSYEDYMCNIFRGSIMGLNDFWRNEFTKTFRAIRTPQEAHQDAYSGYFMQTGILESDELSIYANMEQMKRSFKYDFVIKSLVAQFIHQLVSTVEATTIKVITIQGYEKPKFNRDLLDAFIQGRKNGIRLEDIDGYTEYDKLYHVWNFLKHNSIDLYNKIKTKYPEILYDDEYKNGQLAIGILKIDRKFVTNMLKNILLFFDNLCAKVFDEDIENADWNCDEFFIFDIHQQIDFINNPLGIPNI